MKNYRKFLIPIVLVVLLVLGVSRLDIQSVKNHDMADDNIVAKESDKSSDNDTSSEIKEDENSLQQDDKNDIGRSGDKTDSGDIASDEIHCWLPDYAGWFLSPCLARRHRQMLSW